VFKVLSIQYDNKFLIEWALVGPSFTRENILLNVDVFSTEMAHIVFALNFIKCILYFARPRILLAIKLNYFQVSLLLMNKRVH
jgi:hypothetical protein